MSDKPVSDLASVSPDNERVLELVDDGDDDLPAIIPMSVTEAAGPPLAAARELAPNLVVMVYIAPPTSPREGWSVTFTDAAGSKVQIGVGPTFTEAIADWAVSPERDWETERGLGGEPL